MLLSLIFWNIFGTKRVKSRNDLCEWVTKASIFAAQETLEYRKVTPIRGKTSFSRPARKPIGPGRPAGGLTSYFDNGAFGSASFTQLSDENHFLCIRVVLSSFAFIVGNVYLPLHSGADVDFVELFETQLFSILELFPTDPVIIGGDFNCHLFAPSNHPHELRFKDMIRRLHVQGFAVFPQEEVPFTYHLDRSFSTIDYVLVRGFKVAHFHVTTKYALETSHRPLFIKINHHTPSPPSDSLLQPALGAAYYRSEAKKRTLQELLAGLAEKDHDRLDVTAPEIQRIYDALENCFEICTKRTQRKIASEAWESNLDPADVSVLVDLRNKAAELEEDLSPSSSESEFQLWSRTRAQLASVTISLKRKAVDSIAAKNRREAKCHAATWKLLSSFDQKQIQPELPPAAVYAHYRRLSQVEESPLTTEAVQRTFIGPLTKEDAELERDVDRAEIKRALDDINLKSAPGPDGLPPTMIIGAFQLVTVLSFLARFMSRCLRAAFVPSQWRKAENFVLYKGAGPTDDVSSFRAISLTQILAKVYEKILFSRIWSWFTRSWLFTLPQFGFRPKSSTIDAVFVLLGLIRQHTIVLKQPIHVAFVDITKAFPSLNRQQLFERLSRLGLPMVLIDGVRSFYSNYVSRLRIGTMLTAPYFVTSGTI
jgi:hypothetical protein